MTPVTNNFINGSCDKIALHALVLSRLKEREQFIEDIASGVVNFGFGRFTVRANNRIAKIVGGVVAAFIKNFLGPFLIG